MTDELAKRYEELKARETKEKEEKEQARKARVDGCMTVILGAIKIILVLAVLLIVIEHMPPEEQIGPPTEAKLESENEKKPAPSMAALKSEYTVYFEKPCMRSARYDDGNGKIRAGWEDRIKREIINQARKYDSLSERKKLYAAKVNNCEKIIKGSQRLRASPKHTPDYRAEIEKYVVDRCYRKLVSKARPDLPAPDFRQIEIIKSAMRDDVKKTIKQILPKVRGKPYKERMAVYESAMDGCRLP